MHFEFRNEIGIFNHTLSSLKDQLANEIKNSESLLSLSQVEADYKKGQLEIIVQVVPKQIRGSETLFIILGDQKKQAQQASDFSYKAEFAITLPQKIIPVVSIESASEIRREVLPETQVDQMFALTYDSVWGQDSGSSLKEKYLLNVGLYPCHQESQFLLTGIHQTTIIIVDNCTGTEISREMMYPVGPDENELAMVIKKSKGIIYQCDLGDYFTRDGSYAMHLELEIENGLFYSEQIGSFENHGQRSTSNIGGGVLYPKFN